MLVYTFLTDDSAKLFLILSNSALYETNQIKSKTFNGGTSPRNDVRCKRLTSAVRQQHRKTKWIWSRTNIKHVSE